jgi:hypothetical protein
MKAEDIKFVYIFYRILPEFYQTGIPSEYCWSIDEVKYVISNNIQYRIIFVCKSENIQELDAIIHSNYIYQIYIFGNCSKLNIKTKLTMVNTNTTDLMLDMMCSAIDLIHDEEIFQRESGSHRIADERAEDILKLFDVVETLYFTNKLKRNL